MQKAEFEKDKFSKLDGGTVVRVKLKGEEFTIEARPYGVVILGPVPYEIDSRESLDKLAQLIAESWKEHMKLKPQIARTLSGH